MAITTVQQLSAALNNSAPPNSALYIVDQDGNKIVAQSVTFHPPANGEPYWTSVDVELIPES